MFSFAWRWSSLTQALALSSDACILLVHAELAQQQAATYRLGNVVDDDGAVGVSIIHRSKRLVSLLSSRIPNLKLDSGVLIERNGLGEEGGADSRLAIRIELVL